MGSGQGRGRAAAMVSNSQVFLSISVIFNFFTVLDLQSCIVSFCVVFRLAQLNSKFLDWF